MPADVTSAEDAADAPPATETDARRFALVLGGGGARGLAHIGVLDVLEREGIRPTSIVGSSVGGLVGALSAAGLPASEIARVATSFRFPRAFVLGRLVEWDAVFRSAAPILADVAFEALRTPLAVTAVDFERGEQVILRAGPVLPAVRATCAIPGVIPAEKVGASWLVDGGLLNVLPVDVAWMEEPEAVIAVNVGAQRDRTMPQLDWHATSLISKLGNRIPNPFTAKVSFEVLVRAAEILLAHQTALATAMTNPEILIEPVLGNIGLRDFSRLDEAIDAGRRAADEALPQLHRMLATPPSRSVRRGAMLILHFDPVCGMLTSPGRARATAMHAGEAFYFCSVNCRDCFERDPGRYTARPSS